jgi:hypothetical protein
MLIMPKIHILTDDEYVLHQKTCLNLRKLNNGSIIPCETKPDSFGIFNGNVVCVDYAGYS